MRYLTSLAITGLILSLAACEVGPDYVPPAPSVSADWVSGDSETKSEVVDHNWWTHFNDPVLTSLIEKASSNNFDLRIAEARIAEARASVSSASAALLPTGDIKATGEREANQLALADGSSSGFNSLLHKPFNVFQTGFDASWELDLFGGNRRAEEAAEAQMQASEASRDDVLVSLRAEVARTYILIRQNQKELTETQKTIAADKKTLELAKQRADAGEAAHLDVTQAEALLEQAQQQLPRLRAQQTQTEFSLDVLLGEQPGTAHKLVGKEAPIAASDKKLVLTAPAAVIAQRPDIRVAERKLAAATAQQGTAVAKFFPDISLTAFFGALNTSAGQLVTGGSKSWMAGGSVIWPILSYGTLSANLDAANAQQQEALVTYQKTVLGALADVERSLTAYTEQQKLLQSVQAEVEKDQHARDIVQQRYAAGLTSMLDVLDADRTLYTAQINLTKAQSETSQDLIALYKSLGGGWAKG